MLCPRPSSALHHQVLSKTAKLEAIRADWNSKSKIYIVQERDGGWLLLGQSLPRLAAFINAHLTTSEVERVSATGMYDMVNKTDGPTMGWHKLRWRVAAVPLDQGDKAAAAFEAFRLSYSNAALLGDTKCYRIS